MKPHPSLFLSALLCFVAADLARAEWHVWTLAETRHVLRNDPPGSATTVKLGAARNEWVSFQILLRSDESVEGVSVEPADLNGPGGFLLHRAEARLYRQHQLHLEVGTYRNDGFKPNWYPDPLIPFLHPLTGKKLEGARISAVPFDLPANQTHGFWVDLFIPTNAPPGDYRGVYRVTAARSGVREIPVSLTVWDFALPRTPTLVTEFGSPRLWDYYHQRAKEVHEPEPSDWAAVETQCSQLLSEHRFNAVPPREMLTPKPQPDGSFQIPSRQVQALREFVDRYHVNALQTPHPDSAIKDPETQRDTLRAWLAAFDRAAKELARPNVLFYTYLKDEPNTLEDYRYVQKWGRAVREAKSVIKVLVVEQTWTEPGLDGANSAWGDLYGAVDIWCPLFSLHRQESAAKRQALGETIWTYTALCQGPPTPWWHIDLPLLNYRVPAWMAWRDGMKGLLYWGGMSYWRQTADPWTQAPYYTGNGKPQQGEKDIVFNGEGSLVYPARAVGYDGVVPTIRLKALRDGIQDYEYLAILQRLGKAAEAQKVVRSLTQTFFQWEKDPVAYEQARVRLAAMIVAAQGQRTANPGGASTNRFDEKSVQQWTRTEPLVEAPRRVTEDLPLSDQENHGHWVRFEPMWDEFDGLTLDTNKWAVGMSWWQGRQPAWFNPSNVVARAGQLHLTMRKEAVPRELERRGYHDYTSAALHTKVRSGYGFYEVKARAMDSGGSSSFWFQQEDSQAYPGWATEIDVFELCGKSATHDQRYYMTLHVFGTPQEKRHWQVGTHWRAPWRFTDQFHVYGFEWGRDELRWYVDGQIVHTVQNTHWHQPLYLIFDSETMPEWFGMPHDGDLPSTFSIEYVRAWKHQD